MSTHHTPTTFNPLAGLASLILPGAGHLVLGQRSRALFIAVGVLGLFFGGVFIGGIDVIDSREDRLWFIGQALVGPVAFGVDYLHQNHFKGVYIPPEILNHKKVSARQLELLTRSPRSAGPGQARELTTLEIIDGAAGRTTVTLPILRDLSEAEIASGLGPPNRKSLSKVNELGTLFATIAGMLNIIVVLDAFFPPVRPLAPAPAGAPA